MQQLINNMNCKGAPIPMAPPGNPTLLFKITGPADVSERAGKGVEHESFALLQNKPNPFADETQISFFLPEAMPATISVWDKTGILLFKKDDLFPAGENILLLQAKDLGAGSLLIYRLETPFGTAVRQMLRID